MATEKFKALVHYIIHDCHDPDELGSIRLNKALWFADVFSYQEAGVSITGETYRKRQFGPVPAHILQTLETLVNEGAIVIREPEFEFDTRKFISLRAPNVDVLSEKDKKIASVILDSVRSRRATEISEMTHNVVWDLALEGEEIPLHATLSAISGGITEEILDWVKDVSGKEAA